MLGTVEEEFLRIAARPHRGARVEVYVRLPESAQIDKVHQRHAAAGVITRPLARREWGKRAFHFEAGGYRFLVAEDLPAGR